MGRHGLVTTYPRVAEPEIYDPALTPRARFGRVAESGPVREIIDLAMVGLVGGRPRLAMRAAKVFLEDSYASRASARRPSGRRRRSAQPMNGESCTDSGGQSAAVAAGTVEAGALDRGHG
jgi:hypothetical protein